MWSSDAHLPLLTPRRVSLVLGLVLWESLVIFGRATIALSWLERHRTASLATGPHSGPASELTRVWYARRNAVRDVTVVSREARR